jgi:galactonate dehydratase
MKITDLETVVVGNPWKNWIFIQLHTDEGLVGLGEGTGGLATQPNVGDIEELRPLVIGEDPTQPEALWLKLIKARYHHRSTGIAAVEQACWDILARSLGVPVWRLFGARHQDRLRAYANGWYQGPREPAFFAEKAAQMVEQYGYTALKFDPFGSAYKLIDRESEKTAVAIVRAMRETLGDDVDLLIEAHERFTVSTAIRLGKQLEEFRPFWMETPVRSYDLRGHIEVQRALSFPVVLGEAFYELRDFAELLHERVIDIVQPEPMHLGPSTSRKAFAVAEAYDASVACHQAQSPFCTAMNAQLHGSIPNFLIQECFDDSLEPWTWDVLQGVPRVQDGYVPLPDAPGWGVTLNKDEAAKHPYGNRNFLQLFEEGWERRRPAATTAGSR